MSGLHEVHSGGCFIHKAAGAGYGLIQLLRSHAGYNRIGYRECTFLHHIGLGFSLLTAGYQHRRVQGLFNLLWRDAVLLVVLHLLVTAACGLCYGQTHALGYLIGIQYYLSVYVAGGTSGCLGE